MLRRLVTGLAATAVMLVFLALPAAAQQRVALVIGNAAYAKGPLKTSLADGGLVAEALTSIGFEIVEGADTNQTDLRRVFREFLEKVQAGGPDTIALVYYTGYALQFEGENYLVPADARIERDSDIPIETVRLFDLMRPLADTAARAKLVILDATRPHPFQIQGSRLARGLGAVAPTPGMLVAFSSAPGMTAADGDGEYGAYAQAIAEMVREQGLDLDTLFARIRVRTHQATNGVQTPWHAASLDEMIMLVPGAAPQAVVAPGAPPPAAAPRRVARPMRDYGAEEGYAYAIERDDLDTYVQYVRTYPNSPYAQRIWATIRARREALAWRHALLANTPNAFWTYIQRYPNGMYVMDAERRLRRLSAAARPPSGFRAMDFDDVPPALDEEDRYDDDYIRRGPPPPRLLAAPPAFMMGLPPPRRDQPGLWRRPNAPFPVIVTPGPGPGFRPGGPAGPGGPQWQKGSPGGPGGPGGPQWQKGSPGSPKGPPGGPAVVTPGGPPPGTPGVQQPPVGFITPPGATPGGPKGPPGTKGPPGMKGPPGTKGPPGGPAVVTTPPAVTPPPGPPPGGTPPVGFKGPPGGPKGPPVGTKGPPVGTKGPPVGTKGPAVVTTPPAATNPPGPPPGGTPPVGFGAPKGPPQGIQKGPPPGAVRTAPPPTTTSPPPGGTPPVGFKGPPPQVKQPTPPPPPQVRQVAPPPPPGSPPPVGFGAPKGPPPGAAKGPPPGAAKGLPKCAVTGGKPPCAP